jgi:hypothetical protein
VFPGKYPVDAAIKTSFKETVYGHNDQWKKEEYAYPEDAW